MIALTGYGFVGKAYYEVFKNYFNITIIDPTYNQNKISNVKNLESIICCVGTPENDDGSCDGSAVFQVLDETPDHIPILIKSTISLEIWEKIQKEYVKKKVTYSPEFLKATNAIDDLIHSDIVILSGHGIEYWRKFYKKRFPDIKVHLYSPEEAIMIKYFRNSFLATKVSFFNQIFDICEKSNINFGSVRHGICDDPRIGHSHSFVDIDLSRGWGGMCFPKDTAALLSIAKDKKTDLSILKEVVKYNKKIRK